MLSFNTNISQNNTANINNKKIKNKDIKSKYVSSISHDTVSFSGKTQQKENKNSTVKSVLKIIGATTLSITAGLIIYKTIKSGKLSSLFEKGKQVATEGAHHMPLEQPISTQGTKIVQNIERIKNGIKGKIRTAQELSNKDLIDLFNSQLMHTQADEIEKIIKSVPKEDQILQKKILKEITQFGNLESMQDIADALKSTANNFQKVYVDKKSSLAQTMEYLVRKKETFGSANHFATTFTDNLSNSTVLIDDILLQQLETNKTLLNELKQNLSTIKLITPDGWITGINPFNQTNNLESITKTILERAKTIKASNPVMSEEAAIQKAMREPVLNRLKNLGINTEKLEFIRNSKQIKDINSPNFAQKVADQLNQPAITEAEIENILKHYHSDYHPYIRELIAHGADINSSKSLSVQLKNIHEKIIQHNGGTDKGIYYVVAKPNKSYSVVTMQYQLTNNVPSSKILSANDLQNLPKDAKKLILLDDVAASGDSLADQFTIIKAVTKNSNIEEIITAPILCCSKAINKFNKEKVDYIAGRNFEVFTSTQWYNSLSSVDKKMLDKIMFGQGYGQVGSCITFPYMAPDNNNTFFASEIAKFFTPNGTGVKNGTYTENIRKSLSAA